MNIVDWVAVIRPVRRAVTKSITSSHAAVASCTSGRSCWKWSMWPSDRPDPMGGMPWCSIQASKASGWRSMIAKQWSVPRVSRYRSSSVDRLALGVDRDDRGVLAAGADRDDVGRRLGVGRRELADGVDHRRPERPGSCVAVSPARRIGIGRLDRPTRVPSSATSATLALVLPTSMPSAWATVGNLGRS